MPRPRQRAPLQGKPARGGWPALSAPQALANWSPSQKERWRRRAERMPCKTHNEFSRNLSCMRTAPSTSEVRRGWPGTSVREPAASGKRGKSTRLARRFSRGAPVGGPGRMARLLQSGRARAVKRPVKAAPLISASTPTGIPQGRGSPARRASWSCRPAWRRARVCDPRPSLWRRSGADPRG